MRRGIKMTRDQEDGKSPLNKDESLKMNRGFELLLRNKKEEGKNQKLFR